MVKRAWEYIAMCDDESGFAPVVNEKMVPDLPSVSILHSFWEMLAKYGMVDIVSSPPLNVRMVFRTKWNMLSRYVPAGVIPFSYDIVRLSYRSVTGRLMMTSLDFRHLGGEIRVYVGCKNPDPIPWAKATSFYTANGMKFHLNNSLAIEAALEEMALQDRLLGLMDLLSNGGDRIEVIPTLRIVLDRLADDKTVRV